MINNNLNRYFLILVLAFSFFTSCTKQEAAYKPPEMVTEIIPSGNETDYDDDIYNSLLFNNKPEKPLIEIHPDEVLISTINFNLDLDSQEEQILVLKKRSEPDGKIFIAVADYDNVHKKYSRVWEYVTEAENIRSFVIHLEDLIGDHNNEIVCSGRDANGRNTLDVFWKNTSDNNKLSYIPIFNIAERGTIEINQQDRSRGYLQGLKNGVSFSITVTSESFEEPANSALIKTDYYWDFPVKKYMLLSRERIENTVVAENQLAELFASDEQAFYDFIQGPWYNGDKIIYFDTDGESSTFFTDDIQENYSWVNSYKVLSNLLYIRGRNEIINYIENEIYIRILDLNQILITVRDIQTVTKSKGANDIWTNNYTRMDHDMKSETLKDLLSVIDETDLPELSGQYISGSGDTVEFYGSDFFIKSSFEDISGGFAVYTADTDILSLKIIDDKGIVTEERSYSIDYSEEKKETSIERTLVLTPGRLSIHGFRPVDTEYFRYTQTETLEVPEENTETENQ